MNEVNDAAAEELIQQMQEKAINAEPEDESVNGRAKKFSMVMKTKQKPEPETPFALQIKQQIDAYAAHQASIRGQMIEDLETEHRIEEHGVYREQLERDGSKRRQQRRERRESAHQQKYLASLELKIAPPEHDGQDRDTVACQSSIYQFRSHTAHMGEIVRVEAFCTSTLASSGSTLVRCRIVSGRYVHGIDGGIRADVQVTAAESQSASANGGDCIRCRNEPIRTEG